MWNIFEEKMSTAVIIILCIGVMLDAILVFIIIRQRSKYKMEKELEEITAQYEYEKLYYQELEKNREDMAIIRHDYNNHITSVLGLIHTGRISEAKEMINEMLEQIEHVEV